MNEYCVYLLAIVCVGRRDGLVWIDISKDQKPKVLVCMYAIVQIMMRSADNRTQTKQIWCSIHTRMSCICGSECTELDIYISTRNCDC